MMKSLYLHVPFCNHICAYCDFMRCGYYKPLADQWLQAITKEIAEKQIQEVETIYIGGGTPSSLSVEQVEHLLCLLDPYRAHVQEYTIEVNADSFIDEKIAIFQKHGVNRISLGAQTFQTELLKTIQRVADHAMIEDCILRLHKAGIKNISLDLMYGLPGQTMDLWKEDLRQAIALPIQHISLYALTIEENSAFGRAGIQPCDEDIEAQFYEEAITYLKKHGFEHYEISNFAKSGLQAKHNMSYWHYDDFYGIGCGASGKEDHVRYDNTRNLHTYITQGPSATKILLNTTDEMFEMMMMGLRVQEGVSDILFQKRFKCSLFLVFRLAIEKHLQLSNLRIKEDRIQTTYEGSLHLHDILLDFLPEK